MKMKEESEKAGLQLKIQKTKIMASSPITSWQIDGETMETVLDFIFLGSKITVDGDCNHEIKMLTLWKKNFDKPQFSSVIQSWPTFFNPMDCSMPGLHVHCQLPEFTQIHVH